MRVDIKQGHMKFRDELGAKQFKIFQENVFFKPFTKIRKFKGSLRIVFFVYAEMNLYNKKNFHLPAIDQTFFQDIYSEVFYYYFKEKYGTKAEHILFTHEHDKNGLCYMQVCVFFQEPFEEKIIPGSFIIDDKGYGLLKLKQFYFCTVVENYEDALKEYWENFGEAIEEKKNEYFFYGKKLSFNQVKKLIDDTQRLSKETFGEINCGTEAQGSDAVKKGNKNDKTSRDGQNIKNNDENNVELDSSLLLGQDIDEYINYDNTEVERNEGIDELMKERVEELKKMKKEYYENKKRKREREKHEERENNEKNNLEKNIGIEQSLDVEPLEKPVKKRKLQNNEEKQSSSGLMEEEIELIENMYVEEKKSSKKTTENSVSNLENNRHEEVNNNQDICIINEEEKEEEKEVENEIQIENQNETEKKSEKENDNSSIIRKAIQKVNQNNYESQNHTENEIQVEEKEDDEEYEGNFNEDVEMSIIKDKSDQVEVQQDQTIHQDINNTQTSQSNVILTKSQINNSKISEESDINKQNSVIYLNQSVNDTQSGNLKKKLDLSYSFEDINQTTEVDKPTDTSSNKINFYTMMKQDQPLEEESSRMLLKTNSSVFREYQRIESWYRRFAKETLKKRKALLLYSDFPFLGKTQFAFSLVKKNDYPVFMSRRINFSKLPLSPKLLIISNLEEINVDKEVFRKIITGQKGEFSCGNDLIQWEYQIPCIITTRNFDLLCEIRNDKKLSKNIVFVQINSYIGDNKKQVVMDEINSYLTKQTYVLLSIQEVSQLDKKF